MRKKKIIVLSAVIVILLILGVVVGKTANRSPKPVDAPAIATEAAEPATEARIPGVPVDASWFDDAVFVGDSVTLKLSYYCDSHPEALGTAQFFCAGSLGYASSLWDIDDPQAVHPYYKGRMRLCEYCAADTSAKKVFIMLGMNDIAIYGVDGTVGYADELVSRILNNTPDVEIFMQSVTPILYGHEIGDLNNYNIREFNTALETYCSEKGYTFLDIYSVMADETGYLRDEYCGDPGAQGIHFTDDACNIWADTLKNKV